MASPLSVWPTAAGARGTEKATGARPEPFGEDSARSQGESQTRGDTADRAQRRVRVNHRHGSAGRDRAGHHRLAELDRSGGLAAQSTRCRVSRLERGACGASPPRLPEVPEKIEPVDRPALHGLQDSLQARRGTAILGRLGQEAVDGSLNLLVGDAADQLRGSGHELVRRLVPLS